MSAPNGESAGGESAVVRAPMVICPVTLFYVLLHTSMKSRNVGDYSKYLFSAFVAVTSNDDELS